MTPAAADDPARLAGRVPVRGPAPARRVDTPAGRCRLRDRVQARAGRQARPVRGHLRGSLRRPHRRAVPLPAPARALLGAAGRITVAGVPLNLWVAWRRPPARGPDGPGVDGYPPPRVQRPAVRPVGEGWLER